MGALVYTLSNGLQSATAVIIMPLLFTYLSVDAYGQYGLLMSLLAVAYAVVAVGMDGAIGRMFFDAKDPPGRRKIIATLLPFQFLLTLAVTLAIDLTSNAAFDRIAGIPYTPLFRFALWTAAATATYSSGVGFWRSGERPLRVAAANIASFVATISCIAYFLVARGMGLTGVMLGMLCGRGVVALSVFGLGIRETGVALDRGLSRRALAFALPLVPHLAFGWIYRASDRWILDATHGHAEVGVYFTSYQIAAIITLLVSSANEAFVPRFLALFSEDGRDAACAFHRKLFPWFNWGAVALGAGMIVGGPWIIDTLSSGKVTPVPMTTALLVGGIVMHGLYHTFASALTALKMSGRIMMLTLLTGSLNIALNLLLIPRYGGTGAAAAFLIAHATLLLLVGAVANLKFGRLPFLAHTLAGTGVLAATAWLVYPAP